MAKPYSDDLRARAMAIVEGVRSAIPLSERRMQPGRRAHVPARQRPRAA